MSYLEHEYSNDICNSRIYEIEYNKIPFGFMVFCQIGKLSNYTICTTPLYTKKNRGIYEGEIK